MTYTSCIYYDSIYLLLLHHIHVVSFFVYVVYKSFIPVSFMIKSSYPQRTKVLTPQPSSFYKETKFHEKQFPKICRFVHAKK